MDSLEDEIKAQEEHRRRWKASTNDVASQLKQKEQAQPQLEYFLPQDGLQVLPSKINPEQLPSTPHLNAIMDNAVRKVKGLLLELEQDKGGTKTSFILLVTCKTSSFASFSVKVKAFFCTNFFLRGGN